MLLKPYMAKGGMGGGGGGEEGQIDTASIFFLGFTFMFLNHLPKALVILFFFLLTYLLLLIK